MRIVQIVLPGASEYERKSQRIDAAALSAAHEVTQSALHEVSTTSADLAHVYASQTLPAKDFVRFPLPYVASAGVARTRWPFRKPVAPESVLSPPELPEAVEERYFEGVGRGALGVGRVVGTFARESVSDMVERTLARIHRTRDDVAWKLFDHAPTPEDLRSVDLWVDPTAQEADLDGFVAEALVVGLPVIAARTAINSHRLEKGRTGFLVPCNDANELAHAILTALFKPEVAQRKIEAARQTVSKFRFRQRLRILSHLYETVIS